MSSPETTPLTTVTGEAELIDYFRILWKRRLLIWGGTLFCMLFSVVISLLLPKTYVSSVDLLVTGPTTQVEFTSGKEPRIETKFQPKVSTHTYRGLLLSHYLAEKVLRKLGLDKGPKAVTTESLMDRVSVRAVPKTSLLHLTVEDTDPQRARDMAQTWAELFVEQDRELNRRELTVIGSIVSDKLAETSKGLTEAEEALRRFQEREAIQQTEEQVTDRIDQIVKLEARSKAIPIEKQQKQAVLQKSRDLLEEIARNSADQPSGASPSPPVLLQPLRPLGPSQTAPLVMGSAMSPQDLISLGLEENVVGSQVSLSSLDMEAKQLVGSIDELKKELIALKKRLAAEQLQRKRLARTENTIQATYQILAKKVEEVKVALATMQSTVKIAIPAFVTKRPVRPRPLLNLVIALAVGLITTTLLAFFFEYIDRSRAMANVAAQVTPSPHKTGE